MRPPRPLIHRRSLPPRPVGEPDVRDSDTEVHRRPATVAAGVPAKSSATRMTEVRQETTDDE